MTQKNRTLEGTNRTLRGDGGSKFVKNYRTSYMDDPFSKIQTATYISQKESHMTSIYVLRKIHSIFAIFNGEYKKDINILRL